MYVQNRKKPLEIRVEDKDGLTQYSRCNTGTGCLESLSIFINFVSVRVFPFYESTIKYELQARSCSVYVWVVCQSERKQPFHCPVAFSLPTPSLNQILKQTFNKSYALLLGIIFNFVSTHVAGFNHFKFISTSVSAVLRHFYFSSKERKSCDRDQDVITK